MSDAKCAILALTMVWGPFLSLVSAETPVPVEPAPSWCEVLTLKAADQLPNQDATARYLLRDNQINTESQQRYCHRAILLNTPDAVQEFSQIEVWFEPSYQQLNFHFARVIRDGKLMDRLATAQFRVLEDEDQRESYLYSGGRTAVLILHDIQPGDVLEYAYTLKGWNPVFEGKVSSTFYTTTDYPIERQRTRVVASASRKVQSLVSHSEQQVKERTLEGDLIEIVAEAEDTAPYFSESDTAPGEDPFPRIQFSEYSSWSAVREWAQRLFAIKMELPTELAEKAKKWATMPTEEQRVIAALRFVQQDIRYLAVSFGRHSHKPNPLDQILERKFGDCKDKALLLVAMLRAMNMDAHVALVSSTEGGDALREALPSTEIFDHAVVVLRINGRDHWLDPTFPLQGGPLDEIYFPDLGYGLVLADGEKDLTRVSAGGLAASSQQIEQRFDFPDYSGKGTLEVVTTFRGDEADSNRSHFAAYSVGQIQKDYAEHYGALFPGVQIASPIQVNDDLVANTRTVVEKYHLFKFWESSERANNHLYATFQPEVIGRLPHLPKTRERTTAFASGGPLHCVELIQVTMPTDWVFGPSRAQVTDPHFDFKLESQALGNTLILRYDLKVAGDRVEAGQTGNYIANAGRVKEHLSHRIWVSKARVTSAGKNENPGVGSGSKSKKQRD